MILSRCGHIFLYITDCCTSHNTQLLQCSASAGCWLLAADDSRLYVKAALDHIDHNYIYDWTCRMCLVTCEKSAGLFWAKYYVIES